MDNPKAWGRVAACCAQCMSTTDDPAKCKDLRDDYLECLHHLKEVCVAHNSFKCNLRDIDIEPSAANFCLVEWAAACIG